MKVLFGMALRQTTGFVETVLHLIGLDRTVPDFSTLGRRQKTLAVNIPFRGSRGPLHLLINSTGIKIKGEGEGKHFKFTSRGKQRLHGTPDRTEVEHCRWWLGLELAFMRPPVTLALGATAAFPLTEHDAPMAARRGRVEAGLHGGPVLLTWHPAFILRLTDPARQALARQELTGDLRAALAMARGQVAAGENRAISR